MIFQFTNEVIRHLPEDHGWSVVPSSPWKNDGQISSIREKITKVIVWLRMLGSLFEYWDRDMILEIATKAE